MNDENERVPRKITTSACPFCGMYETCKEYGIKCAQSVAVMTEVSAEWAEENLSEMKEVDIHFEVTVKTLEQLAKETAREISNQGIETMCGLVDTLDTVIVKIQDKEVLAKASKIKADALTYIDEMKKGSKKL